MKSNDGLRLWLVVIQLLVVLKTGFVSGQCAIASSTIPFTEELPIGFVLTNLTTGPWIFLSSQPPNYIVLDNDSFGYHYLKAAKKIDVEDMKGTLIKVTLNCNGDKTLLFPVSDRNEFSPIFSSPSYTVQVPEDASTGTVVFKAADHVTDEDFTKTLKFSALSQPTGQVPDGVASGMFEVAANGDVKVKGTLDYEKQTEYSIEIEVKELPFSNTTKLTITLQNIDDTGPTFIVSNDSVIGRDAVYLATMSVYHMGEIPITGSPILAEDTDTKQYAVKYTPLTGPMSSYFSIDSSSGKVSVIKKLPEDTKLSIMLFFTAEDVSPKKLASRATLGIILNKEPIPTTAGPTTITTEPSKITENTTSTSPTGVTPSSSADSSSVTPGQNQSSSDSMTSTSPTGPSTSSPPSSSSSSSPSSSSVTLGENQTTTDPLQSTPPTGLTSSSSANSSSLTPGQNQNTTDSLTSTSPTGPTSSSSLVSSVTSGENGTATDSSQSTSPTGTSLPLSQPSVTPGLNQSTANSLQSTLPSVQNSTEVSNGEGQTTGKSTDSSFVPTTTTLGGAVSNPYSNGEFFGAVGVLLFIIIILIVVIILGYCWWRKQRDNDDGDSEANLATKPSAIAEYDNLSKNSSKMNGIENNAAHLSGLLESGDLPKEDYDSESQVPPLKSDVVEKIENENLYTSLEPRIPDNAAGDSLPAEEPPIRTIVYDNLESVPTLEDMEGIPDNTEVASPDPLESVPTQEDTDAIDNNTDVASQQSLEVPVTMTFADLGKNNSVSFADDNLLEPDSDGQDDNQTDGLSYVDHIDNDGNNDDDDNHSDSSDKPNDEEMTWVVADNDGSQLGQEDTDQTTDEESPQQSPLPQNNEIAYAPLLDDSQRDSWGTTNPVYDSIRL